MLITPFRSALQISSLLSLVEPRLRIFTQASPTVHGRFFIEDKANEIWACTCVHNATYPSAGGMAALNASVEQAALPRRTETTGTIRMTSCSICIENEKLLKQAVKEHWAAVQKYRAAMEAYEDLTAVDVTVRATQTRMNEAEDSYRQHLRLMHEEVVHTKAPVASTFSRTSKKRCQVASK